MVVAIWGGGWATLPENYQRNVPDCSKNNKEKNLETLSVINHENIWNYIIQIAELLIYYDGMADIRISEILFCMRYVSIEKLLSR